MQLRLELDCPPDAAWDAVRSPRVLAEVYGPLVDLVPLDPPVFPEQWGEGGGEVRVALSAILGLVPLGEQRIRLSFSERGDARVLEDSGAPVSGPLSLVTRWRHRMAVAPAPGGRTLYRDRLDVGAGLATPVVWAALWVLWQWRGVRLRRLARRLPR